jgi:hypothetical protein
MHGLAGRGARLALAQLLSLATLILLKWGHGSLAGPPGESVGSGEQVSARAARPIPSLSSSKVLISCRAEPGAHVTGADLWYTKDGGATWFKQSHAAPSDSLVFDADGDRSTRCRADDRLGGRKAGSKPV